MRSLDIHDPRQVLVHNALATEAGAGGPIHRRYPLADIESFGDMAPIARYQTGIELQVAGTIESLRVTLRIVETDLYGISAEVYRGPNKHLPNWHLDPKSREPQTLTVDTLSELAGPMDELPLRFVYPTHTVIEILDVAVNDAATVRPLDRPWTYNDLSTGRPLTWIAYGDSITHGANTTVPTGTWVDLLAKTLAVAPVNLANGGHGKAEASMARHIAARDDVDLITLNMGVNCAGAMTRAEYAARLDEFLGTIRARHPEVPIVVTSPIWSCREKRPAGKNPQGIRDASADVCSQRRHAGDRNLVLIDGLSLGFGPQHLNADLLHLNEYGALYYYTSLLPHLAPIVARLRA